jgi:hypothetical protein
MGSTTRREPPTSPCAGRLRSVTGGSGGSGGRNGHVPAVAILEQPSPHSILARGTAACCGIVGLMPVTPVHVHVARASPADIRHLRPHAVAVFAEVAVKVDEADAGFDHGVAQLLVDFEDLVHAPQTQLY